jgi:hypothetical protein
MGMNVQKRQIVVDSLLAEYGRTILTRAEIVKVQKREGFKFPYWITRAENRQSDGSYLMPMDGISQTPLSEAEKQKIASTTKKAAAKAAKTTSPPVFENSAEVVPITKNQMSVNTDAFTENLVPTKDPLYVPFGHHKQISAIVKSGMFYPTFITGLSGNGKTYMVEQIMAMTKNKVIRVNLSAETDEDDLIGGFRLVAGETKFFKGPVIKAMQQGATLLLDEIDLANPARIMCLQSILEGSGYFIKKTGEYISIAPGFNVIATANTKGRGSDDGRFIGTNVLNEAFLERFPVTFEQPYPSVSIEKKILTKLFDHLEIDDTDFIAKLVDWADIVRAAYFDGAVDDLISTRRLVHIAKAYKIFGDKMTAIDLCINRFDEDTKFSFRELYAKLDDKVTTDAPTTETDENSDAIFA